LSLPYLQPYFGLGNSLQTAQAGGAGSVGGWVELARTTLGSAGDTITVSSLPDKRYYMILQSEIPSGEIFGKGRFNADSGNNYSTRYETNGATDSTLTSFNSLVNYPAPTSGAPNFSTTYVSNLSNKEKLTIHQAISQNTAGAGTAPTRRHGVSKWSNTSSTITSYSANNGGSGDFASGSEVVVLGWDPADTHTTNFWEELASVELGSSNTVIDSGTITAKKYLWIQCYYKSTGGAGTGDLEFNSTGGTGTAYAERVSSNGGADGTSVSRPDIEVSAAGNTNNPKFINAFAINNASNEKLVISNSIEQNTTGAGTAPQRREGVGKYANTSSQITSVQITRSGAGSFDSGSFIKVWGSN